MKRKRPGPNKAICQLPPPTRPDEGAVNSLSDTCSQASKLLQSLAEKWPSSFVARTDTDRFSGGMVNPKYMANLDSQGKGPPRIRIGRKIGYPVPSFIAWLASRAEVCGAEESR